MKALKITIGLFILFQLSSFVAIPPPAISDDSRDQLFKDFLSFFDTLELPYNPKFKADAAFKYRKDTIVIKEKSAEAFKTKTAYSQKSEKAHNAAKRPENKRISAWTFGDILPEIKIDHRLRRRRSPEPRYAEGLLAADENYKALIYFVGHYGTTKLTETYKLATFDNKGNMIDQLNIASNRKYADQMQVSIDKELNLKIETYEYRSDLGSDDPQKPSRIYIFAGTKNYKINEKGEIIEQYG